MNAMIHEENTFMSHTPDGRLIKKLKQPVEITLIGKEELATDTFVYRF
jgi:hypothetical protein